MGISRSSFALPAGYDGTTNEWEDYSRYMNPEGVEMSAVSLCAYLFMFLRVIVCMLYLHPIQS